MGRNRQRVEILVRKITTSSVFYTIYIQIFKDSMKTHVLILVVMDLFLSYNEHSTFSQRGCNRVGKIQIDLDEVIRKIIKQGNKKRVAI